MGITYNLEDDIRRHQKKKAEFPVKRLLTLFIVCSMTEDLSSRNGFEISCAGIKSLR